MLKHCIFINFLLAKHPDDEEIVQGHRSVYHYSRCFLMLDDCNKMQCKPSQIVTKLEGTKDTKSEFRNKS
ncbi:hypothetical protein OWV82_006577 [Melia azedarach]|uniref:Uncharacterized protein n=1 Tax=Melia azedarach TaxID=155640 RepID=A0ACC1YJF9_MELAZ|nr:hypothetical protein OWV82_006577 [Melia azedarach]